MSAAQHLCFYSAKDRYCSAFLEELARSPYVNEFRFVCVDINAAGVRPTLPPYVRAVPTLMIAGEPEPRVDAAVMNWLSERRLHDRSSVSTMGPAGARAAPGVAGRENSATPAGPVAWGGTDMMGGDEGFAYLDDNTAPSDKGMVRLAGNMASFHDIGAMVAPDSRTVPGGIMAAAAAPSAGTSEKSRALSSAYEAALAARARDVPGPVQRIGAGAGAGLR